MEKPASRGTRLARDAICNKESSTQEGRQRTKKRETWHISKPNEGDRKMQRSMHMLLNKPYKKTKQPTRKCEDKSRCYLVITKSRMKAAKEHRVIR